MVKRLLDCTASDFKTMNAKELKQSILASEGRVMLAETICTTQPLYPELTNAEYAAAFGADLILLNLFDVDNPVIEGLSNEKPQDMIRQLKHLIGRPLGINLEPVDPRAENVETLKNVPIGRTSHRQSLEKARELGVDFICLTGNPKTGVTNHAIIQSIKEANDVFGDDVFIIAGKMHGAGVSSETGRSLSETETVQQFAEAGADMILIPSVGSVPGSTQEKTNRMVQSAQDSGALAMTAIGTSQEGAKSQTIEQMALYNKMAGADVHHIGDAGQHGIAAPENIMAYSNTIRGIRHTYRRMAASINR